MPDIRDNEIIEIVKKKISCSSREVFKEVSSGISYATVKRIISRLAADNLLSTTGNKRGTKYSISPAYGILQPIEIDKYYEKEIDERDIRKSFNFGLITETLGNISLFTETELTKLKSLQEAFRHNISRLSEFQFGKEMERLAIDLSWKSSQIEGNTYTLLETERLLTEKETASGRSREEATMLLNHKEAIDFLIENPDYLNPLSVSKIEDIHKILVKELPIDKGVRRGRVGISGTNYRPLDNDFQIKEALFNMCGLVNRKEDVFEKALLVLALVSYIQPFADGNKRTARIVSNALLMNHKYCPISFRTVDSVDYKKAMLIFYEQNNIYAFKQIFIDQFDFAVNTYF